jgi:hypothetical protein
MGTIFLWVSVGIAALLLLSWLWPKVKAYLPTSVQSVGSVVETKVDQATAATALQSLVMLFNERGDSEAVATLGGYWVKIWAWKAPTTPTVAATPTVESLAAANAALAAKVEALESAKV